jgi:pyruvate dehydrogenase E1 component alpha subunit
VTIAYFGDGASNIGAFHESLNLASLWQLPVIFVCVNNGYAEHTKTENCTAIDEIARRAGSYSMPGVRVNGNSPLELYAVAKDAIERARTGGGPTLIEAMTFRFFGHVFGDDDKYMDPGEKAEHEKHDPYPIYRNWLIEQEHAVEGELLAIEVAHAKEIEAALKFALDSPFPDDSEIRHDVYAHEVIE